MPVNWQRWLVMLVLGVSGGIIFLLPFLREAFYRPLADALALNNTQLGWLMSVFGISSLLSYLPGGWLADRVAPRRLMTLALLSTGLLGFYFATFPGYTASLLIHAGWGVSITLLFWAAMLRATRGWAGADEQGKAFGSLEMLRGGHDAIVNLAMVALFVWLGSTAAALSTVVLTLSSLCVLLGFAVWFVLDDETGAPAANKIDLQDVLAVVRMPAVWMIAVIILSAYSAYWASFYFTPYASDVFALSAGAAAALSVFRQWFRPVSAIAAGLLADRIGVTRLTVLLFAVLLASFAVFMAIPGKAAFLIIVLINVAVAAIAIFALRGIYFALFEEAGVPLAVTGTAVGLVSIIGYTPDIFMPLLGGVLLDAHPGIAGYRYFYGATVILISFGLFAAVLLHRRAKR